MFSFVANDVFRYQADVSNLRNASIPTAAERAAGATEGFRFYNLKRRLDENNNYVFDYRALDSFQTAPSSPNPSSRIVLCAPDDWFDRHGRGLAVSGLRGRDSVGGHRRLWWSSRTHTERCTLTSATSPPLAVRSCRHDPVACC